MQSIFVSAFLLLLLVCSATSQDVYPKLIDRFGAVPCSDLRGRLDQYLNELSKDEGAIGFVVVSGDVPFRQAVGRRRLIENQFIERKFDLRRIHFVRKRTLPESETELWKANNSVKLPFSYISEWSYSVPTGTKPHIVYSGGFNDSECNFPTGADILGAFLRANSNVRGNVVVRCNGAGCFNNVKKWLWNEFKKNGVSRSRLRFFYVPVRSEFFKTEFWLLP